MRAEKDILSSFTVFKLIFFCDIFFVFVHWLASTLCRLHSQESKCPRVSSSLVRAVLLIVHVLEYRLFTGRTSTSTSTCCVLCNITWLYLLNLNHSQVTRRDMSKKAGSSIPANSICSQAQVESSAPQARSSRLELGCICCYTRIS